MSIELKIKAKHLAAEARIIKAEERKAKQRGDSATVNSLHAHRMQFVRTAARSTHLARAFMSGTRYRQVEERTRSAPNRDEVRRLLERYGRPEFKNQTREDRIKILNQWFDA